MHYYNDNDAKACAWLRELIAAGHIPAGDVDDRSIADVTADDLVGYTGVHFFAGIGGWAYALRLAGWPDDRPIWTGSCPCQPFSVAGNGLGTDDVRHLWPEFRRLVAECAPSIVVGEQVSGAAGRAWLSGVRADLETLGYAVGAADLCAAGVGAPHIRQRLYWLADSERGDSGSRSDTNGIQEAGSNAEKDRVRLRAEPSGYGPDDGLADSSYGGGRGDARARRSERDSGDNGLADAETVGREGKYIHGNGNATERIEKSGAWSDVEWLECADGKARPVEPGLAPLAHGVPGRVAKLRGFGNAIVPQVAAQFVGAFMDIEGAHDG